MDIDSVISHAWEQLYANNSKIQAFAVCRGSTVIWQTSNWDLVPVAEEIVQAPQDAAPYVTINMVKYMRVMSGPDFYVSTAEGGQGHFMMSLVEGNLWLVAWATADAIPELAVVDLGRTALSLIGRL